MDSAVSKIKVGTHSVVVPSDAHSSMDFSSKLLYSGIGSSISVGEVELIRDSSTSFSINVTDNLIRDSILELLNDKQEDSDEDHIRDVAGKIIEVLTDNSQIVRWYVLNSLRGIDPPSWILDDHEHQELSSAMEMIRDLLLS